MSLIFPWVEIRTLIQLLFMTPKSVEVSTSTGWCSDVTVLGMFICCQYAHYFMYTHLDPMPGSFLWTSDLPSTHSYQLFCKTLSERKVSNSIHRITDSLTAREKLFKMKKNVSGSWSISTGSPQCCVFSLLLFSLYTNACTSSHPFSCWTKPALFVFSLVGTSLPTQDPSPNLLRQG